MKKDVWVVYYENNGFEIFCNRRKMQEKLKNLDLARFESNWITKSIFEEKISFKDQNEYERELKRFLKKGWNRNIDRQIKELSLLKNKLNENEIHQVNVRKEIESIFNF